MATAILLQLPLGNGVGKIGGKFKSMLQCLKKQHSDWRTQKRSFLSFRLLTTLGSLGDSTWHLHSPKLLKVELSANFYPQF